MEFSLPEWLFENGLSRLSPRALVQRESRFIACDSPHDCADPSHDARQVLEDLNWRPMQFEVVCRPGMGKCDAEVCFGSPLPSGDHRRDQIVLDWYAARNSQDEPVSGPAVIVLDILNANQLIAGMIARAFARRGIHGLVLPLPHSPRRGGRDDWSQFVSGVRQGIADARRARDAVLRLPNIDGRVGIQGTSFGGFIASAAAALDGAFDVVLLALCGGDMDRLFREGKLDAAAIRRNLQNAGLRDEHHFRETLRRTDPLRIAHRLDPSRTWLYSARYDQVVPPACSKALAAAIGLPRGHFKQLVGCHYTCAINAPWAVRDMVNTAKRAFGIPRALAAPAA